MSDIELALIKYPEEKVQSLREKLPLGYILEPKYALGWGSVIRMDNDLPDDIDSAIETFMNGLNAIIADIRASGSVLRISIYNKNVTFTFRMKSPDILARYVTGLELSVYPTMD
jgi:hypothetical protein